VRPPRERPSGGPGFGGGPRRSFGGGGGFGGPRDTGPRPPFAPRPAFPPQQPASSVRLRQGDREVEVSGSSEFVRQILDELPTLLARLRGEDVPPSRPASISMPPPPRATADAAAATDQPTPDATPGEPPARAGHRRDRHRAAANGHGSLEDRVFRVLERADHPLSVAAIRQQLGGESSGQQIRRILERAADRVQATSERPAAYALR
jgi:hypothetical protein